MNKLYTFLTATLIFLAATSFSVANAGDTKPKIPETRVHIITRWTLRNQVWVTEEIINGHDCILADWGNISCNWNQR